MRPILQLPARAVDEVDVTHSQARTFNPHNKATSPEMEKTGKGPNALTNDSDRYTTLAAYDSQGTPSSITRHNGTADLGHSLAD